VTNQTDEQLDLTLDYMFRLYSSAYGTLINQISMPFSDDELWVITLEANESRDFVLTFEVKEDSIENYLFVQDFFEENEPVLFALS
jgi:hypothetical protein